MKKLIAISVMAMLFSFAFVSAMEAKQEIKTPTNRDSEGSDPYTDAIPYTDARTGVKDTASERKGSTNSRSCDPIWKANKGAFSCFDGIEKRNVMAGSNSGICPSVNPEFSECIATSSHLLENKDKDFKNALKFWDEDNWKPRTYSHNVFNPMKATLKWWNWIRKHRTITED